MNHSSNQTLKYRDAEKKENETQMTMLKIIRITYLYIFKVLMGIVSLYIYFF